MRALAAPTSGGHINVRYPEAREGEGEKSGIKDLNGNWLVPPSAGYLNAYAVTPQVMACKSANVPGTEDLRSLPGLELLHEGLSSIYYNAEEDEFIRADKGPMARLAARRNCCSSPMERRCLTPAAMSKSTTSMPGPAWP